MKRSWVDLESQSVDRAIQLWHQLGAEEFIARTRFKESRRYVVVDQGQLIASKPLIAMAFQLQFGCGKEGPPRLSGGEQSRGILRGLGHTLVDTHSEYNIITDQPQEINIDSETKFWWVNQTNNFHPVFDDGTLWAPLKGSISQQVDHWMTLDGALPGDLVIHYASPNLRGVSRVATRPRPAYPPRGYDVSASTAGTLVLLEQVQELQIPRDVALELLENGKGPVTSRGSLRNGYFFPLQTDLARELLARAGLRTRFDPTDGLEDINPLGAHLGGLSDRQALVAIRTEQRFLRDEQLRRWGGGSCSLCGRHCPPEFLVAAHIKPRWACSEQERMDTRNVAMLACLFGCDALFELGYVIVGNRGTVEPGNRHSAEIETEIQGLVGRKCSAYTDESAQYFSWHQQHHAGNLDSAR